MQSTIHLQNPAVRVQQSSPTPQVGNNPMLAAPFMGGGYDGFQQQQQQFLMPKGYKDRAIHKRGSSGSSIASGGPPSPLSQTTINPRIATSDATFSPSYDFDYSQTPQTATSSKMPITLHQPGYDFVDLRRLQPSADGRTSFEGPQSVSSMSHNSPATPQTNYDADYEDTKLFSGKSFMDGSSTMYLPGTGYPTAAYQQSLQDVFPEHAFPSTMAHFPQQQMQQRINAASQNMMRDRLQAAQQDHLRTASPASSGRGDKSPFRQSSEFNMPAPQRPAQQMPRLQKQRTSISPKELMLDEHDPDESNYTSLFPDVTDYAHRRNRSNMTTTYNPTFSQDSSINGIPQQYPFVSQQSRTDTEALNDTPDFPAHLLSMESTNEEGPSAPSSQQSIRSVPRVKAEQSEQSDVSSKPVDTSSDSGTYSCTYHGCALRFDTPAKLQKHKREGHRQQSPSATVSARNSQAGPHRCERINPSTGKPCNSVFSRPYDLTRHEDTIHNARKQKVRCHLCQEEKTFSRNDALTRHMRVVHPDVDWVGKQRSRKQK